MSENTGEEVREGMVYGCRVDKSGGIRYIVHTKACIFRGRDTLAMSNLVRRFGVEGIAEMVASGKVFGCRSCKPGILVSDATPRKGGERSGCHPADGVLPADHYGRRVIGMVFCRSKIAGSPLPRSASDLLFPCEVIGLISGNSLEDTLYIANVWDENAKREPLMIRGADVVRYEEYGTRRAGISACKVSG